MPRRLKLASIEQTPKLIKESTSWSVKVDLKNRPELALALVEIRKAIMAGKPLSPGCYRSGISKTTDELLQSDGIMHLHLGHAGIKELLYLVQYPEYVVFLEVNNHIHLDEKPPGWMLIRDHKRKLLETATAMDRHFADEEERKVSETKEKVVELAAKLKGLVRANKLD